MAGLRKLTEEQWTLVEPVVRETRRADNHGHPWNNTRALLNRLFWVLGTARSRVSCGRYPPFQSCHRRFQRWIRSGKPEEAPEVLARLSYEQDKLSLNEAFVEASFVNAKK